MSAPDLAEVVRWPAGEPAAGDVVLITEREADAVAAALVFGCRGGPAAEPCTVGMLPPAGLNCDVVEFTYQLVALKPSRVYLVLDGDPIGRAWADQACSWLRDAGGRAFDVELPPNAKLATCLREATAPSEWLAEALADAEGLRT